MYFTTLFFKVDVSENHKNSWQHWMRDIWTYILDNVYLHTTNAVLAIGLVFKPFFQGHFWLLTKNRQISCAVVSSGFIFLLKIEKTPIQSMSFQVSI